jgi:hypothetical protein
MFSGCDLDLFKNDPLVARVQWKKLRQSDIEEALGRSSGKQAQEAFVESWVKHELWLKEAKRHVRNNAKLKDQLSKYKATLIIREYQEKYILGKTLITENDVLAYFEKNRSEFLARDNAAFIELFILDSKEAAVEVVNNLNSKINPGIPSQLKLVYSGECVSPLDNVIFSKSSINIIGPVSHNQNYYVVNIIHKYIKDSPLQVEHVRDDIIQKLQIDEHIKALQKKQNELKDRYNVKIF